MDQLTRQAVRLYRVRALLWAVGLAIVATVGFVGLDYSLHVEERGWRWLVSLLWAATMVGIVWRFYPDARSFRLTPVQVSQWIERRQPELGDSLSRIVSLSQLPDNDPQFGSAEFRQAALANYDRQLSQLPWSGFIDKQPTFTAGLFCAMSLLVVAMIALLSGPIASLGLTRIATPWSSAAWPRSEQLELVDAPTMIARDRDLEVQVIDRQPPLPELVELEVRGGNDQDPSTASIQRIPMRLAQDLAVVTLPSSDSDFAIRPVGGDQQSGPWHTIRVMRQPQLKEYAFSIQPPAYTNQTASELVGQRIDVLAGSRVTLKGSFDDRIASLRAIAPPESINKNANETTNSTQPAIPTAWTAVISADGRSFELFTAEEANVTADRRWQFEIETSDGLRLVDNKQWMIHVTTDRPPDVTMAPIEPTAITRHATLDIVGSASDDLGLTEIQFSWHVANQPTQSVTWWPDQNDDADTATKPAGSSSNSSKSSKPPARSVELSRAWSVASASLTTGQTLTVELSARDMAGQVGRSVSQTLEVLDDAAALARLQKQQAEVFTPLRQLFDAQRRNQQALDRTLEIAEQTGALGQEQADVLASAQATGQSIAGGLARNQDSLARQLERLQTQLQRNQLDDTSLAKEVAQLQSKIEELVDTPLNSALKELEAAQQALRSNNNKANSAAALKLLEQATATNQLATGQLGALVESVAKAESLADLQKQIQELASDQAAVANDTQRLQVDAVVRGNSAQSTAQRAGIQSDQQNLARRLEELATRLANETSGKSRSDSQSPDRPELDAASQQLIDNAQRRLLERRIDQQMRTAVEAIKDNELGNALRAQQLAEKLLSEVAAELGGRSASGLESSSASMQDLANQLENMANRERRAAETLRRAAGTEMTTETKRELTEQQERTRDDLRELADQSAMQASQRLNTLLDQATESMNRSLEQTEQSKFEDASASANEAAEKLQAAASNAQQRAEQLKSQVAQQQMFDLRTLLSSAVAKQQSVVSSIDKTAALPSNERAGASDDLLKAEQQVQQLLADGRERLESLDAFDWLLGQCDEELLRTIAALERKRIDLETLASARAALDMLRAAEQAVAEASQTEPKPSEEPSATGQQAAKDESSPSKMPTLASLKLLRQMQTLINQQSEQLLSEPGGSNEAALARMADRQQSLAEQVQRLREQLGRRKAE